MFFCIFIAIIIYKFSTSIVIVITKVLFNFPSFFSLRSLIHCHFANFPLFGIFCPSFQTTQPAAAATAASVAFYCRSDSINVFLLYYVASLRWLQGTPNVVDDPPMRHGFPPSLRPPPSLPSISIVCLMFIHLNVLPLFGFGCSQAASSASQPARESTMDWHLKFTRR